MQVSPAAGSAYDIDCVYGRSRTVVGQTTVPPQDLAIDVLRGTPTALTTYAVCGGHGPVPV